jgi:hypothetical protein
MSDLLNALRVNRVHVYVVLGGALLTALCVGLVLRYGEKYDNPDGSKSEQKQP